jgi:signal transduction histidine kinase
MSYLAFEKNVDLRLKIDEKLYPFIININGDEGRYTKIILNFLSNALKFSNEMGCV